MITEQSIQTLQEEQEERSSLNFSVIYRTLILYWKWFLLSIIICMAAAFLYLRYTKAVYNSVAKVLIKEDNSNRRGKRLENMSNLGMITDSYGIENEQEIIASLTTRWKAASRQVCSTRRNPSPSTWTRRTLRSSTQPSS